MLHSVCPQAPFSYTCFVIGFALYEEKPRISQGEDDGEDAMEEEEKGGVEKDIVDEAALTIDLERDEDSISEAGTGFYIAPLGSCYSLYPLTHPLDEPA
jgi:hypothetical protein